MSKMDWSGLSASQEVEHLREQLAAERKRREEVEDLWHQEQQAHTAAVTRAEQAERERDAAKAECERLRRLGVDADEARERAEADNAAMIERCTCPASIAMLNHPGAAMLERMRTADRMAALAMHDEACQSDIANKPDPTNCALCEYNALKVPRE